MWIKCSKRLPEHGEIVLVTDGTQVGLGFLGCGFYKDREGSYYDEDHHCKDIFVRPVALDPLRGVTHWKPVPNLPLYYRFRKFYYRFRRWIYMRTKK